MPLDVTLNDVVYYASLILCIFLGSIYKSIKDLETKKTYGAGLGILITYIICGYHIYHSLLIVWGNLIIIRCCDKKYIHQLSLAYTWSYLSYSFYTYHEKFIEVPYALWLNQMIALRVVGLAFEIHMTKRRNELGSPEDITLQRDVCPLELPAQDIIAYSYHFIGLHRGPYYRWKMYQDYFTVPFGMLGDCRVITEQKLKHMIVCLTMYLILRSHFPYKMYDSQKFYTDYNSELRFLYNVPLLLMHYLKMQISMLLSTAICTECGFGVYPASCMAVPAFGPTAKPSLLKLATDSTDVAMEQEYNFSMLKNFENQKLLYGPKLSDTLRGWNLSVRYWFWAYPYNNLIKSTKEIKSACTFLVWSIWRGPSVQQFILSSTIWVHIHLEDEYIEVYEKYCSVIMPWTIGFSMIRLFCLLYLVPCLVIENVNVLFKYYHSIYWVYHIILIILIGFVAGMYTYTHKIHNSRTNSAVV